MIWHKYTWNTYIHTILVTKYHYFPLTMNKAANATVATIQISLDSSKSKHSPWTQTWVLVGHGNVRLQIGFCDSTMILPLPPVPEGPGEGGTVFCRGFYTDISWESKWGRPRGPGGIITQPLRSVECPNSEDFHLQVHWPIAGLQQSFMAYWEKFPCRTAV